VPYLGRSQMWAVSSGGYAAVWSGSGVKVGLIGGATVNGA